MGYYRLYIPHYVDIAISLTNLTKDDTPQQMIWTETEKIPFYQLNIRLCEAPVLQTLN